MANGRRGIKAKLEPKAKELYALGYSILEIKEILEVSENTLRKWKADTRVPSQSIDGWDLSRQQSYELLGDIKALIQGLVKEAKLNPKDTSIPDAVAKWASVSRNLLADKRKASDWIMQLQDDQQIEIDYPAIFIENFRWIIATLAEIDAPAQEGLVRNIDFLTECFKKKHLK